MPFLCTSKPASVVAPEFTGQVRRGTMLTENTECSTLQRRRDPQGNTTHREGSEKLAIYTGRSNNRIHLLPKTKCGSCSINNDEKVGLVGKELSHCSDHNGEPTGPSASPCFPACHPRHIVSQTAHGPAIPTTSAAWEPPQQTHHALKATNLTSKLRPMAPKGGGHSEPHQSAGGARHVCDDADLSALSFQRNLQCFGWSSIEICPHFPRLNWRSACLAEEPLAHLLGLHHSAQALHGSTASVGLNLELFWGVLKLPEHVPPLSAFDNRVESSTWSVPLCSI